MCIAFFVLEPPQLPGVALLLAHNRDEFIDRPTQHTHVWSDQPHILAGRDMQAGGTWMAVSSNGRVAFLTNLREDDPDPGQGSPHKRSRGELPTNFLNAPPGVTPLEYCQGLDPHSYHGFNLVCVDLRTRTMAYANNSAQQQLAAQGTAARGSIGTARQLEPGVIYGLSNGLLGEWPKVEQGVATLQRILDQHAAAAASGDAAAAGNHGHPHHANGHHHHHHHEHGGAAQNGHAAPAQHHSSAPALPLHELFNTLMGDAQRDESRRPMRPSASSSSASSRSRHGGARGGSAAPPREREEARHTQREGDDNKEGQEDDDEALLLPLDALVAEEHIAYITSARFVQPVPSKFGPYGTRTTSVLAVYATGEAELWERYLVPARGEGDVKVEAEPTSPSHAAPGADAFAPPLSAAHTCMLGSKPGHSKPVGVWRHSVHRLRCL